MKRLLVLALLVLAIAPLEAQFGRRRGRGGTPRIRPNVENTHEFTFVWLEYSAGGWNPGWFHDYPRAERNFAKILDEVTFVEPYLGGSNILKLDDPELFKYPLAYLSEPGAWNMNEREVDGLRNYLLKGGFLIVDDFGGWEWQNFEWQMRRAVPSFSRCCWISSTRSSTRSSTFAISNSHIRTVALPSSGDISRTTTPRSD